MNIYDILKRVAIEVRDETEQQYGADIEGLCAYCSGIIKERLKEHGIEAHIVEGEFEVDYNWEGRTDYEPHYWIEYDGYIIDITADQFNDRLEKKVSSIIIDKREELPRHIGERIVHNVYK